MYNKKVGILQNITIKFYNCCDLCQQKNSKFKFKFKYKLQYCGVIHAFSKFVILPQN